MRERGEETGADLTPVVYAQWEFTVCPQKAYLSLFIPGLGSALAPLQRFRTGQRSVFPAEGVEFSQTRSRLVCQEDRWDWPPLVQRDGLHVCPPPKAGAPSWPGGILTLESKCSSHCSTVSNVEALVMSNTARAPTTSWCQTRVRFPERSCPGTHMERHISCQTQDLNSSSSSKSGHTGHAHTHTQN